MLQTEKETADGADAVALLVAASTSEKDENAPNGVEDKEELIGAQETIEPLEAAIARVQDKEDQLKRINEELGKTGKPKWGSKESNKQHLLMKQCDDKFKNVMLDLRGKKGVPINRVEPIDKFFQLKLDDCAELTDQHGAMASRPIRVQRELCYWLPIIDARLKVIEKSLDAMMAIRAPPAKREAPAKAPKPKAPPKKRKVEATPPEADKVKFLESELAKARQSEEFYKRAAIALGEDKDVASEDNMEEEESAVPA